MLALALPCLLVADLAPLYQRLADDTRAGRPIVLTAYVALCDVDSQGVIAGKHEDWCRGRVEKDLYWTTNAGAGRFLDNHFERLAYDDHISEPIAARGVWKKRVPLGKPLIDRGAPSEADLIVVAIAYAGPAIARATTDFIDAVASDDADTIDIGGTTIRYGGGSHLIGFLGHDYFMDVDDPSPLHQRAKKTPVRHRGAFALSCSSDTYFRPVVGQPTTHIMVLNESFTYPSFFTVSGMLDGILAGESHEQILMRAARAHAKRQGKTVAEIRSNLTH